MAKMRIYELARELVENGLVKENKNLNIDIINLLSKNGIEGKSHSSNIEEEEANIVRNYYSGKSKKQKPADKAADTLKTEAENKAASNKAVNEKTAEAKPEKKIEEKEKPHNSQGEEKKEAVKNEASKNETGKNDTGKYDTDKNESTRNEANRNEGGRSKRTPVGKLIGKGGRETPYWIAKDGRLVGMDGKALPFKMQDGKIVKMDGSPLLRKPAFNQKDKKDFRDKSNEIKEDEQTVKPAAPARQAQDPVKENTEASVEEVKDNANKAEKPAVSQPEGPQPRIVGNIFESLAAAKDKEQAIRERRAAQQQARSEQNGQRRDGRRDQRDTRDQKDQRDFRSGQNRGDRPYNRDSQGQNGGAFDRRNNDAGHRPFRDRPQNSQGQGGFQSRRPGEGRPGAGRPFDRRGNGPAGFGDKDKDEDTKRVFSSKRNPKSGNEGQIKSELSAQIGKNDRAGKLKNKGKDKKDKRDYDDEVIIKKDPNRKGAFQKPVKVVTEEKEDIKVITIPEMITIKELADKMKQNAGAIVKKLFLAGKMINQNSEITFEEAEEIAMDYEIICEKEAKINVIEELLKETDEDPETLKKRPPVVCVMGHVDHGKTSLLDAIRSTNVTSREAGGITQHIGAYMVEINGQKITFLDTPGHEAFTSMRMRGAKSTDIAILVVAADDGVMPQTVEAINHAKAANVSIIVAINKIDKPGANIERVKQELTEYGLVAEDWGGDTVFVPVSAKTHEGIENLLEMVLLTADVLELKANPDRKARGIVIEAERDRGKGCIATVLVQKGTLNVGDYVAIGASHGRIRAMIDDKGKRVKIATPSTPVEIQGLDEVPNAGEIMLAVADEKEARNIAQAFIAQSKEQLIAETKARLSLDGLFSQIQAGNVKELNLIIKADVMGSVEAVKQSLVKLSNEEVVVRVIHGGVGNINESDVNLAGASNAIIIGFNVKPDNTAKDIAEHEGVEIKLYKVIYNAIDDIEAAMKGMLKPVYEERIIAHAEVRQTFKASQIGIIAGSFVLDGKIERGCSARITRDGEQIFDGPLASLKRFKDDVKEVAAGYECGLVFEKFSDLAELDQIEFYKMVEVPRS